VERLSVVVAPAFLVAGGVQVGTHGEPGRGTVFGLVAAGDLQRGLDRPECSLAAVVGEGHMSGVVGEPEHGVRLIAQAFWQVAGCGLFSPRGARMLRQPDGDAVVEGVQVQQQGLGGQSR
jgi:hypothetical protein